MPVQRQIPEGLPQYNRQKYQSQTQKNAQRCSKEPASLIVKITDQQQKEQ